MEQQVHKYNYHVIATTAELYKGPFRKHYWEVEAFRFSPAKSGRLAEISEDWQNLGTLSPTYMYIIFLITPLYVFCGLICSFVVFFT